MKHPSRVARARRPKRFMLAQALRKSQKGQALVELVLVVFLFVLFVNGVTQLVMVGSAEIKLLEASRRGAWLRNRVRNSDMQDSQIQAILPGVEIEKISGHLETGFEYRFCYRVPAVGVFRWFKPQGFLLTTRSAVIADVHTPKD